MSNRRTHYVTTDDGIRIGGTVDGQGPPLVFVHGSMGDGDLDWQALLPQLTGRFTCYLPSRRGRGLSGDHRDHSPTRVVNDIISYVDSIEAPTGLVAWSAGATLALTATGTRSDAVTAVAVYEPPAGTLDGRAGARLKAAGRYIPALLNDIRQAMQYAGPDPADPEILDRISAPMLVLHGPDTRPFFTKAARHVADHVPNARLEEIPDAGHAAP